MCIICLIHTCIYILYFPRTNVKIKFWVRPPKLDLERKNKPTEIGWTLSVKKQSFRSLDYDEQISRWSNSSVAWWCSSLPLNLYEMEEGPLVSLCRKIYLTTKLVHILSTYVFLVWTVIKPNCSFLFILLPFTGQNYRKNRNPILKTTQFLFSKWSIYVLKIYANFELDWLSRIWEIMSTSWYFK